MRKKELLFGFGAGLLVATSVLGVLSSRETESVPVITKEQIKKSAEEMQMVILTPDEYEQWQQEKKVSVQPTPTAPKAPKTPSLEQTSKPQTNSPEAPEKATVDQTTPPKAAGAAVTQTQAQSPAGTTGTTAYATTQTPTAPIVETPKVVEKKHSFTVPYKATAEQVARILVDEGVLPADNKFVDQLRSQNKLNRIRVGTYEVSDSATEAEIATLITTPPKK
ncbi:DNA polymerase III subunit gamma/tau [Brevibacillus reuszeri]|uniref:DNA polymerase III subunit gamma/tau n=1 Tax=Brevibacillus reuszeri TaxID=54915 RepID=UPI00289FEBC8|nr:DNA polymerase III subunit gamma/tau [Brevibacillus reuszeri]